MLRKRPSLVRILVGITLDVLLGINTSNGLEWIQV